MSKKPRKPGSRAPSKAASAKSKQAATKRPSASAEHDMPERIARALEAIAAHLSAASPAPRRSRCAGQRRRLHLASERPARAGAACQPRRSRPARGHRPDARHPDREYRAFCQWAARQQCAVVGRTRHGKILAGQGNACQHQRQPQAGRPPETDRDSPRGYREPAGVDGPLARLRFPLHRVLRRPVVRRQRRLLQVAQGGAGGRHRRPARQCDPVCDLEPAASFGARDDRERTIDRDQSRRSGRGEGLAVRPLRLMARLSPLQPGRISRDGERLLRPFRHQARRRRTRARGAGMVDHARRAIGTRRLAVHAGTGGTAGREAEG